MFKQTIGRGTRILEEYNKFFFTIMDFKKATKLFSDPDFDGDPIVIYEPDEGEGPVPPDPTDLDDENDDETTAAIVTYAYEQIDQARAELKAVSK